MNDLSNQHTWNPQKNQMVILGSGTSTGTPISTCRCHVCSSLNPSDKRLRSSVLITTRQGQNILIDVGPDFRAQSLIHNIEKIDAVIITHDHADHCHGIDDLRPFSFGAKEKAIPVYVSAQTAQNLSTRFPYIFSQPSNLSSKGGSIPRLELKILQLDPQQEVLIGGDNFSFFPLPHGNSWTMGIYHQGMAYLIDCHAIPQPLLDFLAKQNIDLLILDCARNVPHSTHLHWELSLEYFYQINPRRCGLIHISHDFLHQSLWQQCQQVAPNRLFPLADGLILDY